MIGVGLLRCPMCGGGPVVHVDGGIWRVMCGDCRTQTGGSKDPYTARMLWNRRGCDCASALDMVVVR